MFGSFIMFSLPISLYEFFLFYVSLWLISIIFSYLLIRIPSYNLITQTIISSMASSIIGDAKFQELNMSFTFD